MKMTCALCGKPTEKAKMYCSRECKTLSMSGRFKKKPEVVDDFSQEVKERDYLEAIVEMEGK
jgi:endogenous inhibitor of DNA gyrase (YacG/DUF329 family)